MFFVIIDRPPFVVALDCTLVYNLALWVYYSIKKDICQGICLKKINLYVIIKNEQKTTEYCFMRSETARLALMKSVTDG